jgi:hypothetical protein
MNQKNYPVSNTHIQTSSVKYLLMVSILISLILPACMVQDWSTEPENDNLKIKGSGNLISEEMDVPYFHSISMNTAGLVTVTQGTEQHIEVTVDDNIMEHLSIRVHNDELIIEVVRGVSLSEFELTIDVIMTDLKSLVTNSAGSIKGINTFEEDQINLMVNSAGNIILDLKANQLNSMINSAGNLLLSGQVTHHNAMLSSAGNLSAFDLYTETTVIMINSAGNAQVTASKLLDVTINSVGCVYYKGDPVLIQRINSIGRVISAN